ncbi:hypothetical protein HMPREF1863_00556 [Aedoeadaptatus coxii]|uniref:Uncharacterized protein n=1 Tax=Aedoeadaptatus coxii TaxID=755172 RepID=A0A134AI09_9FIRM|nr:hypothetical protein HMPREF1863_00556 [Peptoniphilus coxii]
MGFREKTRDDPKCNLRKWAFSKIRDGINSSYLRKRGIFKNTMV